jgi:hypothetical protein
MKSFIKSIRFSPSKIMGGDDIPIPKPALQAFKKIAGKVAGENRIKVTQAAHLSVFLIMFIAFLGWSLGLRPTLAVSETDLVIVNKESNILQDPSYNEEILWFARLIYSETKNVNEQIYVAWVARNRVENGFRGHTYKQVALAPSQFSGLNSFDHNYAHNINLDFHDNVPGWKTAIEVAKLVYDAPETIRPFPEDVLHFYSPYIVNAPHWALDKQAVHEIKDNYGRVRFAFYGGVK